MLIRGSPLWMEAAVLSLSHSLTTSSLTVISPLSLGSPEFCLGQRARGLPSFALATPHPDFIAVSFQALLFPKPHCLVGYPQDSPGFSLSCQHSHPAAAPRPLSVGKTRGLLAVTETTSYRGGSGFLPKNPQKRRPWGGAPWLL